MGKNFFKRITIIFGTRPEAIKLARLIYELKKEEVIETRVISTGQHKEMVQQVNDLFDIEVDKNLELMKHGQSINELTSNILNKLREEFLNFHPDLILVQGDTTSAFAAALAAFYEKIPVGHVEAGLRTESLLNPYPEELNRRLISQISSLHFAPTQKSFQNLSANNIKKNVFITGNTIIDALLHVKDKAKPVESLRIDWDKNKVLLASVHRRENWGNNLEEIALGLKKIIDLFPEVYLVLPMHKNLKVREPLERVLGKHERVILCEPFNYLEMIGAIKNSYLIVTDSGGLQEEAPTFGKPVLVLRETTERNEGIEAGVSKLIGTNQNNIVEELSSILKNKNAYDSMSRTNNPYGDGKSSERIKNICLDFLGL